jgi:hypothetical protein
MWEFVSYLASLVCLIVLFGVLSLLTGELDKDD